MSTFTFVSTLNLSWPLAYTFFDINIIEMLGGRNGIVSRSILISLEKIL